MPSSWFIAAVASLLLLASDATADDSSPRFSVPGHDAEMALLNDLFERHRNARSRCTLWDGWLPNASVWPAIADGGTASADAIREFYKRSLTERFIDRAGYVSMNQHRGLAHPAGWPFPTWPQSRGAGWHFTHAGDSYARSLKVPLATRAGFQLEGLEDPRIDPSKGLITQPFGESSSITTPPFLCDAFVAPFVTIEWSRNSLGEDVWLAWTSNEFPEFSSSRRVLISDENARPGHHLSFSAVPTHQHPLWRGTITRLRVAWSNSGSSKPITLRSIHTAIDTRHPITNSLFCRGVCDVFAWTGDVEFLRNNIRRVRRAVQFAINEFAIDEQKCVLVPWVGHDGRAGFHVDSSGKKTLRFGTGVGNNYWDLLPCGHLDFLATLYLFDALRRVAEIETAIAENPDWKISSPPSDISAPQLLDYAAKMKAAGQKTFWNDETQRYVLSVDADGAIHDYGFTFANLEAIAYGFASSEQAAAIMAWLDGRRLVPGDTAQGRDIYHWRFAPRATTRRNIEWYAWVWHAPGSIPWGGQVQDGGAVLGFSYHDLMARLKTNGPDDAWNRLREILNWYDEVQAEGGYRAYYSKPGRGTLQGGGTAGGLGMDKEFMESMLVPQFMLDGFLGVEPTPDALLLNPQLPTEWPSLTVSKIHYHDHIFDLTATRENVIVRQRVKGRSPLNVRLQFDDLRTVEFVDR